MESYRGRQYSDVLASRSQNPSEVSGVPVSCDTQVSDDEDDTHPNIDTPSLFRWRHQARVERMAEQKKEKDSFEVESSE